MMRDVGADEGAAEDKDGAMMVMVMTVDDDDVEAGSHPKALTKEDLDAMRDELEELKRKYNMKEPERAFMDEAMRDELEELKRKYNMKEPERAFMDEVKTWEMERLDPNSHRSVDPKRFHISANGGKKFNNDEANKCGNYNVLLQGCDTALYDAECSWDKSHEALILRIFRLSTGPETSSSRVGHFHMR
ncbi:hypothetical protein AK812_SmicGene18356 [Symbiodinium microadriaticum]|uniref:Uncharacterized protein n=1 Tax=Symbiodinium microadriaticum TaxID=2951 RepID=A0A1Q9DVF8_SYMMI|nr:hypothetical protein AK812_SmicGene18356 [Symbiodinium microadriaticum]